MRSPKAKRIKVVDIFAGAGGLGLGAKKAGCELTGSVELDPTACSTLRANGELPSRVYCGDVSALSGDDLRRIGQVRSRERLIVVGGPPCQPFSKAAYWTDPGNDARFRQLRAQGRKASKPSCISVPRDDERRNLVFEFLRLVVESRADGFVFENVPSIRHPRNRELYSTFVSAAQLAGFHIVEARINAAEFGVAQVRERIAVLGAKRNAPETPIPTHTLGEVARGMRPAVTAGQALEGLDDERYFEPEELVNGRWAKHLREVPPGSNYKAHTAWGGHPRPTFVAETRFWNFLLKLSPQRPSWTLAASPGPWTGPFHWHSRRLRTRELAVLQGFPASYVFCGSRRERVRQIGNAVPVPVAARLVRSVMHAID